MMWAVINRHLAGQGLDELPPLRSGPGLASKSMAHASGASVSTGSESGKKMSKKFHAFSSTLSIFRVREAGFYKSCISDAGVFQRRDFKRRLKTALGNGNCKSFADFIRNQNG
jgi:hypothetical protein